MNQEDKDLLLKDLCARLPYKVKVRYYDSEDERDSFDVIEGCEGMDTNNPRFYIGQYSLSVDKIKPYLFPLSSMTEEQKAELENLGWNFDNFEIHNVSECFGTYREYVAHLDCFVLIDWLNKNNFDYRGLIPKDLANDATGLNIY